MTPDLLEQARALRALAVESDGEGSWAQVSDWIRDTLASSPLSHTDYNFIAACDPAFICELVDALDALDEEVRAIDSVLARRPALADLATRTAKIERAITIAGRHDEAERKVDALAKEVAAARRRRDADGEAERKKNDLLVAMEKFAALCGYDAIRAENEARGL